MLKHVNELMKKYHKKLWVLYQDKGSDEFFSKYFFKGLDTKTICLVSQDKIYLLVCSLDKDNIKQNKIVEEDKKRIETYIYDTTEELKEMLEEIISKLHFPEEILLSYSTMSDQTIDILSHGAYIDITTMLKKSYSKYKKRVKFSSAEKIIYDILSVKSDKQLERLKKLACITDDILRETFSKIVIGMSEIEMVELAKKVTDDKMRQVTNLQKNEIMYYDTAWKDCPIVLVGENLAKGGHSLPSDKRLQYGETIYFDFGIKVEFMDGEVLYTDMQRMGYAKSQFEKEIPKSVKKVFDTLVNSIEDGMDEMKPDVKGYFVDQIVRKKIVKLGYPDYSHATGHAVGINVHDSGAVISLKASKRANLTLVENGVYTLEPRISIVNGGSIEEMIQVTKFGGVPLCNPQKELYIVT